MPAKLLKDIRSVGLDTSGDGLIWGKFYWKDLPTDAKQLYGTSDEIGITILDDLKSPAPQKAG